MSEDKDKQDRIAGVELPRALTVGVVGALIIGGFQWYTTTNEERAATAEREQTIMKALQTNTSQLETIRQTMATEEDVAKAKDAAISEAKRESQFYTDKQVEPVSRQQATIDANLESLKERTVAVEHEVTKGFERMDTRLREIDRSVNKAHTGPIP